MTLTPLDFVLTLGFLGLTIAISAAFGLGLTRQWITAGGRTLLQLAGLGYLLAIAADGSNNAQNIPWAIAVTLAVIALGVFNIYKQVQGLPRWVYGAIALGLGGALLVSTGAIVLGILRPAQWASPPLWFAITAAIATPASHGTAQTALALHQTLVRRQRQRDHRTNRPANAPSSHPSSPLSNAPLDAPESPSVSGEWVDDWDWGEAAGTPSDPTISP
ncbi:MAG: ABC transporter permease, partial [Cyanobacteria bacterium P01_H01_bin.130]